MIDPTKLCQIEIQVTDLKKSLEFYEEVMGWRAVPAEIHLVTVLEVPSSCSFGISLVSSPHQRGPQTGSSLTLYFAHEDPEQILAKAGRWGGKVRFGPKKLPGYGHIYQIEDPNGVRFGLFKQG